MGAPQTNQGLGSREFVVHMIYSLNDSGVYSLVIGMRRMIRIMFMLFKQVEFPDLVKGITWSVKYDDMITCAPRINMV